MLPQKYLRFVTAFIMSIVMVFIMTGVITAVNTGVYNGFIDRWWHAMVVAWPIAFLIILMISKQVQLTAHKICSR